MPTELKKRTIEYADCCGVVVPIACSDRDEEMAYREMILGMTIVYGITVPIWLVIMFCTLHI